ncbi:DEKNAAC101588 [Brettanomyces naardenensis]|uniref:DEKNAAC101588 n=1 Tax=Brettanomyces naardenensis TaxID=13370 RepID=A0A448YIB0_BRENA|nr:DEKNAAC101588 [Brettanomyces naardenensis]
MTESLQGKIAVITGGNSGIGLAIAKRFVADGAIVFIAGRRKDQLDKAVSEIGLNSIAVQTDVSKIEDIKHLFEVVKSSKFYKGKVDILIANAGTGGIFSLDELTEEAYYNIFDINVKGVIFTVKEALPLLGKGSSVILTSSVGAFKGFPGSTAYTASKAAVRSLARSWTVDFKGKGIRVNVVSPGPIDTPMLRDLGEEGIHKTEQVVPLGRIGEPAEAASVYAFLASDESSFLTGADIQVDGGFAQI